MMMMMVMMMLIIIIIIIIIIRCFLDFCNVINLKMSCWVSM